MVTALVTAGASMTVMNNFGFTPLHFAADCGYADIIMYLLSKDVDLDPVDQSGNTPLHIAASNGELPMVTALVTAGASMTVMNNVGSTPLHFAADFGYADIIMYLLSKNAYLDPVDLSGNTPLHLAVSKGYLPMVTVLVEAGASMTVRNKDGYTPLHVAADCGYADIIMYLLSKDVYLGPVDQSGNTPLHIAACSGELPMVTALVTAGASMTVMNNVGSTPLHIAADFGYADIIMYLLSKNAYVDPVDQSGNTPLHIAASKGYLSMVTALVEAGASMTVRNNDGCTPLHLGARNADIIMYFMSKDVYPDPVDQSGNTPLYNAVYFGHLIVVKELVNAGASMIKKNNEGMTPLYWAAVRLEAGIIEFYVTHRTCSNRDRIESLELLGAAYVSNNNDINVGYHYMFLAMRERFYAYSQFFNLKKNVLPTLEAYGDRLECRNFQELINIQYDHNALHMEALMVFERVLGEESLAVPRELTLHSMVLANTLHFDLAISLLKRVIHLNHKYDRHTYEGLENLFLLYFHMLQVGEPIKVSNVMDTLELCLKEIKRDQVRLKTPDMSVDVAAQVSNDRNISAALNLLDIIVHITKSDEEETCLFRLVKGLNDIKLTVFSSNQALTPLHVLCDNHCNHNALLVELLLKCRADPNQIDKNGNTPLHFIVRSSIDLKTQHEIITHLIEYGAHIDRANHHGDSVCDEVTTILGTSRHINLKCLAARVVRKNEIPYVGEVPVDLYEFIEMH